MAINSSTQIGPRVATLMPGEKVKNFIHDTFNKFIKLLTALSNFKSLTAPDPTVGMFALAVVNQPGDGNNPNTPLTFDVGEIVVVIENHAGTNSVEIRTSRNGETVEGHFRSDEIETVDMIRRCAQGYLKYVLAQQAQSNARRAQAYYEDQAFLELLGIPPNRGVPTSVSPPKETVIISRSLNGDKSAILPPATSRNSNELPPSYSLHDPADLPAYEDIGYRAVPSAPSLEQHVALADEKIDLSTEVNSRNVPYNTAEYTSPDDASAPPLYTEVELSSAQPPSYDALVAAPSAPVESELNELPPPYQEFQQ